MLLLNILSALVTLLEIVMQIAKDLTGQVFGRLTVVKRHGSHNGKALWLCNCKCGGTALVMSTSLTRKPVGNRVMEQKHAAIVKIKLNIQKNIKPG